MASLIRQLRGTFALGMLLIFVTSLSPTVHLQQKRLSQNSARPKSVSTKTAIKQWYIFKGPDNDFTLNFPAKPTRAEDVLSPVTILRRYVSATDTTYFEISIQDFGGAPDSLEANSYEPSFEQNLSHLLKDDGFRIVQLRRTAKNIYDMEAWAPSSLAGKYMHNLARGVLHNGRQYRMGCNSLLIGQEVDKRVCRRFFNSFRIVGAPQ